MSEVVDGAYDTPEGRKLFVSLRPGESSDEFVTRAMGFMYAMSDGHALDKVLASEPNDWEVLPSERWWEAVNLNDPRLRLRLTALSSTDGSSVGHLVVECEDQQVADSWGDFTGNLIFLPRVENGRLSSWEAMLWRLVHTVRGVGDLYDSRLERSDIIME
jgi:hypothetical protein